DFVAVLSIVLVTWINTRGLRIGKIVQNIFTVAKVGSLAGLVIIGFWSSTLIARQTNFTDFWRNAGLWVMHPYPPEHPIWTIGTLSLVAVALVGALFSADAWNNITFTAAEAKNPSRHLPLSLGLGGGVVITLYPVGSVAFLGV